MATAVKSICMNKWLQKYQPYIKDRKFLISTGLALVLLAVGVVMTYFGIIYATERASSPVTDIILSNTPVFDLDALFLYGPVIFYSIIGIYIIFFEPKKIPFTLKSIATFVIIRSLFISMTHIGPFPTHLQIAGSGILGVFTTGSDLFFSSHTGLPFLMALVFWDNKHLRYLCLFSSILFAAVVLLAHLHYSIDVFAAFFITYTIFHLAEKFFKEDRQVFYKGL